MYKQRDIPITQLESRTFGVCDQCGHEQECLVLDHMPLRIEGWISLHVCSETENYEFCRLECLAKWVADRAEGKQNAGGT